MLSALSRPSLPFRLSQAYIARSIAINQQHQPADKERLRVLCEKVHPLHLCETATGFDSFTKSSLRKMSSTTSSINLTALGNNFVKKVPTMEVNAGHFKFEKIIVPMIGYNCS